MPRKLTAITFLTLDGVMQSPKSPEEDPSNGFTRGGWAAEYYEATMPQVMREAMSESYDILFGRRTYDLFASHWPKIKDDNPVANIMNSARKYVVTSAPDTLDWKHSIPVSGDVKKEIQHLKEQEGPLLQIHGSGQLIRSLLKHHLVDELRLWIFPVVVGAGQRLFDRETVPEHFKLTKTEACANGVIMSIYQTDN